MTGVALRQEVRFCRVATSRARRANPPFVEARLRFVHEIPDVALLVVENEADRVCILVAEHNVKHPVSVEIGDVDSHRTVQVNARKSFKRGRKISSPVVTKHLNSALHVRYHYVRVTVAVHVLAENLSWARSVVTRVRRAAKVIGANDGAWESKALPTNGCGVD